MSSYVALARKWRPAQFSDIVGQGAIVRTLMNAIKSKRVHPAYLLTGSRGIGKTSIARILAKAIQCPNPNWGGTGNEWLLSCGECASCREIAAGTSVDVIEIDGASNNGVDAVREIRENAKYLPATGTKKIYIIDEVHMLTTAAFNALLKTIEEPPPHVIFIFATTEPHKIPSTILSRCQRFDLRRVTAAQVQTRLAEVIDSEKITYDAGALALLARASEGSMRDALSLLDQVIAFSGDRITTQSVRESIGLIEGQTLTGILRGIFDRKPLEALALIESAYQQGHDLRVLTRGLIEFIHAAILAKLGTAKVATLELSEEEWGELQALSPLRSIEEMELIFQVLHHGLDWIARSPQPKIVLDILVVKCATAEALVYAGESGGGPASTSSTRESTASSGGHSAVARSSAIPSAPIGVAPPAPVGVGPTVSPPGAAAPSVAAPPVAPSAGPNFSGLAASLAALSGEPVARQAPRPDTAAQAPIQADSQPTAAQTAAQTALTQKYTGAPEQAWETLISRVRQSRPLLASILEHGICDHLPGQPAADAGDTDVLLICFRPEDSYFREQLLQKNYSDQVLQFGRDFFGSNIRLRVELREAGETLAARRERERTEREKNAKAAAHNHPMIAEARALFGGELGPIEIVKSGDEGKSES